MSLILSSWGTEQGNLTRFKRMSMLMGKVIENKGSISGSTRLLTSILTPFYGTINMWCKLPTTIYDYNPIIQSKYTIQLNCESLYTYRFYVDEVPIRVYKNNEAKGIPYPKMQAMGVYSTLWEADDWATRGGLEKIDWNKAPFYAYYKDFDIEGCTVPGPDACTSNLSNWWESATYQHLDSVAARRYRWVRVNHMVYDYCTDKRRYPVTPPECMAGI